MKTWKMAAGTIAIAIISGGASFVKGAIYAENAVKEHLINGGLYVNGKKSMPEPLLAPGDDDEMPRKTDLRKLAERRARAYCELMDSAGAVRNEACEIYNADGL